MPASAHAISSEHRLSDIGSRHILEDTFHLLEGKATTDDKRVQQVVHEMIESCNKVTTGLRHISSTEFATFGKFRDEITAAGVWGKHLGEEKVARVVKDLHECLTNYQNARATYEPARFEFPSEQSRQETLQALQTLAHLAQIGIFSLP